MTSYLIDINVWLALTWGQHPNHSSAVRWFNSSAQAKFLFCRFTMLGLLRLLTNRSVLGDSTVTLGEAFELYDQWMQDPRVELAGEPRGTETLFRLAVVPFYSQAATKALADCYLAGFAAAAGANLVTFDKGLASAARARKVQVTAIRWSPAPS